MSTMAARRPRFLTEVPEAPAPEPVRFLQAAPRERRAPAPPPHEAPTCPPPPPAPDLTEIRREALGRVSAAVETLRAQAARLAEQARADAVELAFHVARKILETEISRNPEALFALVRSAVRRAGESRRVAIRLSPEDAALLQSTEGIAATEGLTAARIEYFPDPSLQRGDCLVDTDFGQVDGRLGTRLGELRRAVDGAAEGAA
jgi:flagellar assembly protein FliH